MGHALDETLQDTIIRYKRMSGYCTLWVPGTDHAGIATQIKVEEMLRKEKGLTRHDLGREKFTELVWDWKHKYGSRIISQLKALGSSCDWTRERFTMDETLSKAVRKPSSTSTTRGSSTAATASAISVRSARPRSPTQRWNTKKRTALSGISAIPSRTAMKR